MEYSRNIPKKPSKREILKFLEYGILQEYSKTNFLWQIEFFVGDINYVIFKNLKHGKWEMEYFKNPET